MVLNISLNSTLLPSCGRIPLRRSCAHRITSRFHHPSPQTNPDDAKHTISLPDPKPITILGSTGSIGRQTLDICAEHPEEFQVAAISARTNVALLAQQIAQFRPKLVGLYDHTKLSTLKDMIKGIHPQPEIVVGTDGAIEAARFPDSKTVVTGIVGCASLHPVVAAIEAGKDICLTNKETIVAGGPYIVPLSKKHGINILPADSEHSGIFQCMQGLPEGCLRRVILTASGGAFRDWTYEEMMEATLADALKHPTWNMGEKITIDSATSVNKGLEVIEAHYLFGVEYGDIEVVIHPEGVVHSMVETSDLSILAQLGPRDMRLHLLYALTWPRRISCSEERYPRLDFSEAGKLSFYEPDRRKYPALDLAYAVGRAGGTMTAVFNAANEKAVELFVGGRIGFMDVVRLVEAACEVHKGDLVLDPVLEDIEHCDQWARDYVIGAFR